MLQVVKMAHLVQTNIGSTVRAMLKFLFNDKLLQEYTYNGQTNKKAFSSLYSCSLIFGKKKMNILTIFCEYLLLVIFKILFLL